MSGPAFADLAIGDELPPLVRGPLTPLHLMRFSAAIENWHRIHYDERFAIEHDGLPGLLVSGSWKQHLVAQMLRAWAGPDGWMQRLDLQFRRMNIAGDTLTAWGGITDLGQDGGVGVVRCEVGIRDAAGVESSPGTATCLLRL
jgi:acyl dehydratase